VHDRAKTFRHAPDGTPEVVYGSIRDISERRGLVERRRVSETRFADVTQNVPGAIFRYVVFPDGHDEIEYMSQGCLEIWEVPAEVAQNRPDVIWALIHPDDLSEMQHSVSESAANETPWRHAWRIVTPTGKLKWLRGFGQPQRRKDGSVLWNSLILDITEEKKREAEINNARAVAVEANQAKSRFLASVSHELRTPLNAIIGYSEVMSEGLLGPLENPKYREYTGDILRSSYFLLSLIDDLLDLTEFETRPRDFELNAVSVASVVNDVKVFFPATEWERVESVIDAELQVSGNCLLYTSPSPRD